MIEWFRHESRPSSETQPLGAFSSFEETTARERWGCGTFQADDMARQDIGPSARKQQKTPAGGPALAVASFGSGDRRQAARRRGDDRCQTLARDERRRFVTLLVHENLRPRFLIVPCSVRSPGAKKPIRVVVASRSTARRRSSPDARVERASASHKYFS
jgi:hypothetical protein